MATKKNAVPAIPNQQKTGAPPRVPVVLDRERVMHCRWGTLRWIRDETQMARGRHLKRLLGRDLTIEEWPRGVDLRKPNPADIDELTDLPIVLAGFLREDDPEITVELAEEILVEHQEAAVRGIFAALGKDFDVVVSELQATQAKAQEEGADGSPLALMS